MSEEIIGGYRLQKLMHPGQSSQVWEVVEVSSHRHFAMKLLLPEKANRPLFIMSAFSAELCDKKLREPVLVIVAVLAPVFAEKLKLPLFKMVVMAEVSAFKMLTTAELPRLPTTAAICVASPSWSWPPLTVVPPL